MRPQPPGRGDRSRTERSWGLMGMCGAGSMLGVWQRRIVLEGNSGQFLSIAASPAEYSPPDVATQRLDP
jgi:hypothetical protein